MNTTHTYNQACSSPSIQTTGWIQPANGHRLGPAFACLALAACILILGSVAGWAQTVVPFTISGTWTCPAGVTTITVECRGGGGAGGSATGASGATSNRATGGGGAGGAYAESTTISVTPGAMYTVTVGAGGVSSATDGATVPGGASWFNTPSTIFAEGGAGGASVNGGGKKGIGGTGSTSSSIGTTLFAGGNGFTSTDVVNGPSSGGGGSGGNASNGNSATSNTGATAVAGGGAGANGPASSGSNGSSAAANSGGGGGAAWAAASTTLRTGGAGGSGKVTITYAPAGGALVVTLPGQTFTSGSGNSADPVTHQVAGTPFNITITATQADGITQDPTYTGMHTISYSGPSTSNGAPVYTTNVSFTSGQATGLATTLNKAQTTAITVTDGTLTGIASSNLVVTPGAAAVYLVTVSPAQVAGNPFTVNIAEKDAETNTITTDSTTVVTLSSSTGNVQFDGTGDGSFNNNSKTLNNGAFNIPALDNTAEMVTITATDGVPLTGTSGTITLITPAQYQSRQSGNWNDFNTWQINTGSGFTNAISGQTPSSTDGTVAILTGHIVTVTAPVTVDQVTINSGGQVTLNSGIGLTIANGIGTDFDVSGIFNNAGNVTNSTGASIVYESGGTYQHNFGTAGLIPAATWNPGSTCEIDNQTATGSSPPTGTSQLFYNFTWNCPSQVGNINFGGTLTTVNGNFTVLGTSTNQLRLGSSTSPNLTVGGDWVVQGGTLVTSTGAGSPTVNVDGNLLISGGTLNLGSSSGTTTLNLYSNVSLTAGVLTMGTNGVGKINFVKSGTQTFTNGGTISGAINWSVNDGSTLDIGTSTLGGTGTLTVNLGCILEGNGLVSPGATIYGTITPDTSIGTLTFAAPPALAGVTSLEINRSVSPNANQIAVTNGTLVYGGTLDVINLGPDLQPGDTFTLFTAPAYSSGSSFATTNLPSLDPGLMWDTTQLTVNGTAAVAVIPIPPPQISGPVNGVLTMKFFGIPLDNYIVQTTTDLTTSSWLPISTNATDGTGAFTFTDTLTNAQQFYRTVPQ